MKDMTMPKANIDDIITRGELKKEIFKQVSVKFIDKGLLCCDETRLISLINLVVPEQRFFNIINTKNLIETLSIKVQRIVAEQLTY